MGKVVWLVVVVVVCLLPFLNKKFTLDDPVFLWAAKYLETDFLNPYGFTANWGGILQPAYKHTFHGPFVPYFIFFASKIVGWGETALHASFLLPTIFAVVATFFLARELSPSPAIATLTSFLTPPIMISATTLMGDIWFLAFWVGAICLWVLAEKYQRPVVFLISSVLLALAVTVRFNGLALIPLLGAYSLLHNRRLSLNWLWLIFPMISFLGYQTLFYQQHGSFVFLQSVDYVHSVGSISWAGGLVKSIIFLVFTGGCLIPVLFFAPLLWHPPTLLRNSLIAGLAFWILFLILDPTPAWYVIGQKVLFALTGLGVMVLTISDVYRHRTPDSILLFLWVFGVLFFVGVLNWSLTGRSWVTVAPAIGILVARKLSVPEEIKFEFSRLKLWQPIKTYAWPLLPSACIALACVWADYRFAQVNYEMAGQLAKKYQPTRAVVRFFGNWGFQYYLELLGAKAVHISGTQFNTGDILFIPVNNSVTTWPDPGTVRVLETVDCTASSWCSMNNPVVGLGFYSHFFGDLPFAFGPMPPESYIVCICDHPFFFRKKGVAVAGDETPLSDLPRE